MRQLKPGSAPECATEHTLRVIGGGWKIPIVNFLSRHTKRYSELQRYLRGISPRVLAKQLRELERDGIITRKIYPTIPPKVEYSLTPVGRSLKLIVEALFDWGAKHMAREL
jgi:DNA-binding HxlR family transcriptional regulator